MSIVPLSMADLSLAALLILVNGAVSVAFRLGLERGLLIAAARMVVQLAAIGYVLKLIFAQSSLLWTLLMAAVMVLFAAYEAVSRQTDRIRGLWSAGLGGATLLVVGSLATLYVTSAIIRIEPWHAPRVLLPILGMILGNALTGVALVLETMTQTAKSERAAIEARLALGHQRYAAFEGVLRRGLTTALMPILNSMAVCGVVAMPGMMTGQILSGADPVDAAKYQIMIMFAISGSTAFAALAAALGWVQLVTDERTRLRLDRLVAKP